LKDGFAKNVPEHSSWICLFTETLCQHAFHENGERTDCYEKVKKILPLWKYFFRMIVNDASAAAYEVPTKNKHWINFISKWKTFSFW